ncbi:hypothetical protein ScalyP_jg6362 [Parmales sp. scaly parma]|nr:hypothetical protein ScalyP_jg6362 [Parmales sp. scaly parma]
MTSIADRLSRIDAQFRSNSTGILKLPLSPITSTLIVSSYQQSFQSAKTDSPAKLTKFISSIIDHTNLSPLTTNADIEKVCEDAAEHQFISICINSSNLQQAKQIFSDKKSDVLLCTVIGFPLGATLTLAKCAEAKLAIAAGASEIDMVINIGKLKSGLYVEVFEDVNSVFEVVRNSPLPSHAKPGAPWNSTDALIYEHPRLKVILETGALTNEEIIDACLICKAIGVDFVKTSTGFGYGGAKLEHVKLMKSVVGDSCEIKASGGVKTMEATLSMIEAGASRIGASSGVAIIAGQSQSQSGSEEGY